MFKNNEGHLKHLNNMIRVRSVMMDCTNNDEAFLKSRFAALANPITQRDAIDDLTSYYSHHSYHAIDFDLIKTFLIDLCIGESANDDANLLLALILSSDPESTLVASLVSDILPFLYDSLPSRASCYLLATLLSVSTDVQRWSVSSGIDIFEKINPYLEDYTPDTDAAFMLFTVCLHTHVSNAKRFLERLARLTLSTTIPEVLQLCLELFENSSPNHPYLCQLFFTQDLFPEFVAWLRKFEPHFQLKILSFIANCPPESSELSKICSTSRIDFINFVVEFLDSSDELFIEQAALALSGLVFSSDIRYCLEQDIWGKLVTNLERTEKYKTKSALLRAICRITWKANIDEVSEIIAKGFFKIIHAYISDFQRMIFDLLIGALLNIARCADMSGRGEWREEMITNDIIEFVEFMKHRLGVINWVELEVGQAIFGNDIGEPMI
jgi:hypothetical protein